MHEIQGMTLFFGAEDALSNWRPARFTFRGVEFTTVEQFMMYSTVTYRGLIIGKKC